MRDDLEKRIFEKPGDVKRHQEYAAELKQAGDPRGEFIELQIQLEEKGLEPDRKHELERRERSLLAAHGRGWLGDLADYLLMKGKYQEKPGCKIWFKRGWVDGLQLDELNLKIANLLLKTPQMQLLRRLVLTEALNATCDYLHEWGLLDKIKELDLSYGRITDKGALTLAGDKSIKKLDVLDLTGNQLTEVGITAIKKAVPKVLVEDQNPLEVTRPADSAAADESEADEEE